MSREHLQESLEQLHEQLASLGNVDPAERNRLLQTLSEIEDSLDETEDETVEQRDTLIDRLRESAEHFEGSHPTFTGMLGSVIDALGRMGI